MSRALWTDEFLDAKRLRADEVADRLVDEVYAQGKSSELNVYLRAGRALSPDLAAHVDGYLAQTAVRPTWADAALIDVCEAFFDQHGLVSSAILCCASLPECYLDDTDAPVLTSTKQLIERTERRVLETSHMVVNAMTEGDLEPTGAGTRAVQRVRLMHAAIRRLLTDNALAANPQETDLAGQKRNLWELRNGKPINQEAMAYVILTFSHVALRSLDKLNVKVSRSERIAYLHTWSVVGALMGVDHDLLVGKTAAERETAIEDAEFLFEMIKRRRCYQTRKADYGVPLTRALIDWMTGEMPRFLRPLPREMMILLMGDKDAARLGYDPGEYRSREDQICTMLIKLGAVVMRPLMRVGFVKRFMQWLYHAIVETEWARNAQWNDTAFGLPPALQKPWEPEAKPAPTATA